MGRNNEKTKQGWEVVFGVNHLGHFLLTYLLLDLMKASAPSRIINVSSLMHKLARFKHDLRKVDGAYPDLNGYSASKAANVLHARELSKRLQGLLAFVDHGSINLFLPPSVATLWNISIHFGNFFMTIIIIITIIIILINIVI